MTIFLYVMHSESEDSASAAKENLFKINILCKYFQIKDISSETFSMLFVRIDEKKLRISG